MVKRRKSALAQRVANNSQAFTTSELNSLLFVTVASVNGWSHKLNPSNGQALAMKSIPCLPPMTLFGLSRLELDAMKHLLQCASHPRRKFKAWTAVRNYRNDKFLSDGMITIINEGRYHAHKEHEAPVSGREGRGDRVSGLPGHGRHDEDRVHPLGRQNGQNQNGLTTMNLLQKMHEHGIKVPKSAETDEELLDALLSSYDEMREQRNSLQKTLQRSIPLVHKLSWMATVMPERKISKKAYRIAQDSLDHAGLSTPEQQAAFLAEMDCLCSGKLDHERETDNEALVRLLNECFPLVFRFLWVANVWNDHNYRTSAHDYIRDAATRHGVNTTSDANAFLENLSHAIIAHSPTLEEERRTEDGRQEDCNQERKV